MNEIESLWALEEDNTRGATPTAQHEEDFELNRSSGDEYLSHLKCRLPGN